MIVVPQRFGSIVDSPDFLISTIDHALKNKFKSNPFKDNIITKVVISIIPVFVLKKYIIGDESILISLYSTPITHLSIDCDLTVNEKREEELTKKIEILANRVSTIVKNYLIDNKVWIKKNAGIEDMDDPYSKVFLDEPKSVTIATYAGLEKSEEVNFVLMSEGSGLKGEQQLISKAVNEAEKIVKYSLKQNHVKLVGLLS